MSAPAKKGQLSFEPVETLQEAQRLVGECARSGALAQIFTRSQKVILVSKLAAVKANEMELVFRCDVTSDPKLFLVDLHGSGSTDCYVNLTNERNKLFFKTGFVTFFDDKLVTAYPKDVFRVQRREFLRYKVPRTHVLRAELISDELPEVPFSKKLIDLSAGGVGVMLDKDEAPFFAGGTKLSRIKFTVNGRVIHATGEVRHARPTSVDGKQMFVAGILFVQMHPADRAFINQFVFEHHRAMLSRFL